ncbi:MAG: glycosyltransferase [Eubacteriales bacterium]
MLLSIIVPVYNVQGYIRRCVNSLLKSDPALEYEIVLVDDGSTDGSGAICDEYSSEYDYIKTIHKSNGGLSDARNYGLKNSVGTYVLFIDSDDYVEEHSIDKIYDYIRDEQCDIYCCDYYSLCGTVRNDIKYSPIDTIESGQSFLKYQLERGSMVSSVVQNIYKRTLLTDNNLYFKKGIYHEDEEWYPRVFLAAQSVKYLDVTYYVYIIRSDSIMQQKNLTKHITDFISTMTGLLQLYEGKIDVALFNLLKDNLVDKYLSIYARGNFGRGTRDIVLPGKYLKKGLVHKKTKMKLRIFMISRSLFCKISQIYNARR